MEARRLPFWDVGGEHKTEHTLSSVRGAASVPVAGLRCLGAVAAAVYLWWRTVACDVPCIAIVCLQMCACF